MSKRSKAKIRVGWLSPFMAVFHKCYDYKTYWG